MTQALHTAPVCEKHGCEKVWHKNKARKSGGQWVCRICNNAKNPEARRAATADWAEANPSKKACSQKRWRMANPEANAVHSLRWRVKNPDINAAKTSFYRARKRNATVPDQPVTAAAIAERFALFDGCAYCGADKKLTIDHFMALNDGGLHVASNLVGACGCCNSSKCDSPVEEWFRSQPFFSVERWERLNGLTCA